MARRLHRRAAVPADSGSESEDDRSMLRQSQPRALPIGTEPREWISAAEWTINIQQNCDVDRLRSPSAVSIFKVPNFLKDSKKDAYVPKIVSLGPYHHRKAELPSMDNHKGRALRRMTTRFNIKRNLTNVPNNMNFSVEAKNVILQAEDEIRKGYEEKIDCDGENLAMMLSFDGCFILEVLRTLGGDKFPVADASNYYEPIFERNKIDYTGFDILNDILMLENQIPVTVLLKLLQLELYEVPIANVQKKLFKVLVKATRSKFYPFDYDMSNWSWPQPDEHVQHLLGLLHGLIVYADDRFDPNGPVGVAANHVKRIPRAVELRNAGIKFERSDGGIKKIRFEPKRATICLPPINITDHTEVLFRNLVAFEVCKASKINYVTCYLSLMDELIDSDEDVAVLRRSNIVTNYLGSDAEVADLFNGLCKGVTVSRVDVLGQVKRQVNDHYTSKFKVWFAELMKEHFSSPWRSLALAAAIIVVLLTAVQALFSIFSVYKP